MEKRAKKGRGWHGDSAGHSKAARQRGKKNAVASSISEESNSMSVEQV